MTPWNQTQTFLLAFTAAHPVTGSARCVSPSPSWYFSWDPAALLTHVWATPPPGKPWLLCSWESRLLCAFLVPIVAELVLAVLLHKFYSTFLTARAVAAFIALRQAHCKYEKFLVTDQSPHLPNAGDGAGLGQLTFTADCAPIDLGTWTVVLSLFLI